MPEPFDYERLVAVIRDEIGRAVQPLVESQTRLESAIKETYTREVMDLKISSLQDQITENRLSIDEAHKLIGGFWTNTITKAAAAAGLLAILIELWKGLHP